MTPCGRGERQRVISSDWLMVFYLSSSISDTWKNCLEGATDFKEVNEFNVLSGSILKAPRHSC